MGAPELARTTTTSLCSTACLVTVGASPAAASAGRPATGVTLMCWRRTRQLLVAEYTVLLLILGEVEGQQELLEVDEE